MEYVSTRGQAPALGFRDVLMAGLARDGGLYVPASWPLLSSDRIGAFRGRAYDEVAAEIIHPFIGDEIPRPRLQAMCREAYAGFDDPAVTPLTMLGKDRYVLELFHGPTLAFKDVAMQLLARMMDHVLGERDEAVTIVGATSGDTGAAAIEAFRDHDRVDVFILFPEGRISPIQQRQMTTTGAANVFPIAIRGTFDDCQAIVKGLFADSRFRERVAMSGINSINWARILGQAVYYFTAAVALGGPEQPVSFTVPTGNFGDIYAGYVAKRMGLPIETLVVAANVNDILPRAIATGRYQVRGVTATSSPSMDIQVSSNFERLLFEAYGRDAAAVRASMAELAELGSFTIAPEALAAIRADFAAGSADEAGTAAAMAKTYAATGFLADPHTGVGLAVAEQFAEPGVPMITLATAHAAKFPDAVRRATGATAEESSALAGLAGKKESYTTLANDPRSVAAFIEAAARAAFEVRETAAR